MAEFLMPSLGSDMQEGTLLEWRVKPGDRVKRRDVIAVVDTDKAAIEVEVFEDGVVEALLVQPGEKVPVGTVLALIRTEAVVDSGDEATVVKPPGPPPAEAVPPSPAGPETMRAPRVFPVPFATPSTPGRRIKASPYARRLAAEHSIDLGLLRGTGPEGAVRAADVRCAMAAALEAPVKGLPAVEAMEPGEAAAPTLERPAGRDQAAAMRRAIAAAMARSKREIPHYYLQTKIDMSHTLRWLEAENLRRSIKERLLPVVPLIRAVAMALQEVPELNGYWIDDRHEPREAINIGFAISLRQGGLIVPAILGADLMSVDELMEALRDLIMRTRTGGLRGSELTEATISVTSLGDLGIETVFGVIYPPQVALVGFGKIMEQPWAESGMLAVRPVLSATLSADHRATDGRRGAQFLDALNRYLQEPSKL